MRRIRTLFGALLISAAFALLMLYPSEASRGAVGGLQVCARMIVPALFPFFVLSRVLMSLGIPARLGRMLAPVGSRLFGISGEGVTAFLFSLCGGYPLGASVTAELHRTGRIGKKEAERMLGFCNNCGPAFLIGAVGGGVFQSAGIGLLLWGIHAGTAVLLGLISAAGRPRAADSGSAAPCPLPFSRAISEGVRTSVTTTLTVCGFVVFFSVITALLDSLDVFPALAGELAAHFPVGLKRAQSLLWGLLELGGGIASMEGVRLSPGSLALSAFITGWGGLSVHFQTIAVLGESGLSAAKHTAGRFLHGVLSALLAYTAGLLLL